MLLDWIQEMTPPIFLQLASRFWQQPSQVFCIYLSEDERKHTGLYSTRDSIKARLFRDIIANKDKK